MLPHMFTVQEQSQLFAVTGTEAIYNLTCLSVQSSAHGKATLKIVPTTSPLSPARIFHGPEHPCSALFLITTESKSSCSRGHAM